VPTGAPLFMSVDELWIFSSIHAASDVEPLTRTDLDRPGLGTSMIMKWGVAVVSRVTTRAAWLPAGPARTQYGRPGTDRDAEPGILDPVPPS
jgi:hypothetical protein